MDKKPVILIIDDKEDNRIIAVRHLAALGFETIEAKDGMSGIREMRNNQGRLDWVLLDWMMPDLSGIEIYQQIQQHPKLASVPVVIVSARTDSESRRQATEAGVTYFLGKPFDRGQLQQILTVAIAKEETL